MRFISSMTWVKKGVSKTPVRIKIDENEMKELFAKPAPQEEDDEDNESENEDEKDIKNEEIDNSEEENSENLDEEQKINKKYNLDDYDDEG